ncbi:MAG: TetR/AcrR family transcriptional regulator [Bdellovibrionaceae bacterium]|nr:TetR/AcrR family transcriptional regulator [Bdellovibrionales bacterium]MCB9253199.1 TetR/AcrR family transcriptional regulator [Pseudobdellovibrionaceae bacterium]
MSEELGITEQSSDTKKRILDSALKIFAEHGFDGASIRSISQEAKVNIAAINYHFGNKENLYFEVVRYSYTQMNVKIQELNAVRELSLEELAVGIFDLLQTKSSMLVNTFRMLLSGRHVFDRLCEVGCEGPPGGDYIAAAIRRKIPKITDADLFWAVRSLFSLIIHQSLILCIAPDNKMKMKATAVEVRDGIGRVAQLVLSDLSKKYSV